MKKHSHEWFKKESRRIVAAAEARTAPHLAKLALLAIAKTPERPALITIFPQETENALAAVDLLEAESSGWRRVLRDHPDRLMRQAGMLRLIVFGPAYEHPDPVESVQLPRRQSIEEQEDAGGRMGSKLHAKYGPAYKVTEAVDITPSGVNCVCEVWRIDDWIKKITAELTPAEVITALDAWKLGQMFPEKKDMGLHLRQIAKLGGSASASNKDESILDALQRYKRRPGNSEHTMTTATNNIVENGLLSYKDPESLRRRLSRMGKRMTPPQKPSEIYATL